MLNLEAKSIPHSQQRYETTGDYYNEGDKEIIRVSDLGDSNMEWLIFIHEAIEKRLTEHNGIEEPEIKAFDEAFEASREPGNLDEPGDDSKAPYYREHQWATSVERLLAWLLKVDWHEYEKKCNSLSR